MNIHKNARLTPLRREEMALAVIEDGVSQARAALQFAVTAKIVKRWVERYKAEGRAGMGARSSRPQVQSKCDRSGSGRPDRCAAAPASHGQAHCMCVRRLAGHGEPGAGAGRTVAVEGP